MMNARPVKRGLRPAMLALGAAALILGFATNVDAGSKQYKPVEVVSNYAWGSMGSARNSGDNNQYIGCTVNTSGSTPTGNCYARNAAGTLKTCTTTNFYYVEQMKSLASDSYIYFGWNASGQCTTLSIGTMSSYEPKRQ